MQLPIAFYHELKSSNVLFIKELFTLFHLICLIPGIIVMVGSITALLCNFNNLIVIGVILSFIIPLLLVLCRWQKFNDGAIIIEINNQKEVVVGFNIIHYVQIIFLVGLYGYYFGFSGLSEGNFLSILWILFVLFFQLILVFPDKLNNVVSCDLRVGKYCAMFLGSYLLVFMVFAILFQPILLGGGFSLFNYLSISWFLSKGVYLVIGCLFAYLVFRNYNKS